MTKVSTIVGIESSCDDTGVAVVVAAPDGSVEVKSNIITPQDHTATSGVVPELAARHHANAIVPTVRQALDKAGVTLKDIDAIAVTKGPGLIACLLVGVETAKALAVTNNIPIIGVNHMEAHIASTFVEHPHVQFPGIAALVSGGHTLLVGMKDRNDFFLIGTTRDDAAGEAFDKVATMLGLPYPGGPEIARTAESGNPHAINFPRPMLDSEDFDFSFAGLKTAVRYFIRDNGPLTPQLTADIAADVQESIIEVVVSKTIRAAALHHAKTIILGGGVSANKALQQRLQETAATVLPEVEVVIPSPGLFTDNGAMIAIAAAPRVLQNDFDHWNNIQVNPKLKLVE